MHRTNIASGSSFESQIGYSRAVVVDDWILVSGTTGYDYSTGAISSSVAEQAEQTLQNISQALTEAGSSMADVVRVQYVLPNKADFPATWPVLKKWFGEVGPAAMMIEAGLMKDEMKIEIEVTARKGAGRQQE
ncbi:uncharacterized protein J7T54_006838 [Emericellopsis cladophorae]|uniref:Uncharacterized protein n=1 Tax=Emericellopsis cladophorae TaxID=2686198 RepID=A0A9Q0BHK4_9HYPO|nr:uncharacterized protein J7T54_006838 [Emericellopsis cladophorae]KAI6785196.1 hypothetical protein J7T54_006838 [Emericellopsis cladophorae]